MGDWLIGCAVPNACGGTEVRSSLRRATTAQKTEPNTGMPFRSWGYSANAECAPELGPVSVWTPEVVQQRLCRFCYTCPCTQYMEASA